VALNTGRDIKNARGTGAKSEQLAHIRPETVTVWARSLDREEHFDIAIGKTLDTARSVHYRVNLVGHRPFLAGVLPHTGSRLYEQGDRVQAGCPRASACIVE
jgi:hypothetical protein